MGVATSAAFLIGQIFLCLLAADFLSGLFHWIEDTYFVPGRYAWFDRFIVAPNIMHHRLPGLMRNNTYAITNAVTLGLTASLAVVLLCCGVHAWQVYLTLLITSHSNQYHQWAHTQERPAIVTALQRIGLLQSPRYHGIHHRSPYAMRFCTTTRFLNPLLDGLRVWRGLEWFLERVGITVKRCTVARSGY